MRWKSALDWWPSRVRHAFSQTPSSSQICEIRSTLIPSTEVHPMTFMKCLCAFLLVTASPLFAQQPSLESAERVQNLSAPKLVGYFPQWGVYNGTFGNGGYFVKNVITSGSASRLTHLNYAFANVVNNQCASFDTYADYQFAFTADETVNGKADSQTPGAFVGNFHQLQELKERYPQLHIVMSIGGGSAAPNAFSAAALPANRAAFVKSCVDMYIHGNFAPGLHKPGIFDGFDIDWEYPASNADMTNLTALLKEFRKQFDQISPDMTLSLAVNANSWAYQYINLNAVQHPLSSIDVMGFDFDGPWNNTTGFVAPLYQSLLDPCPACNVKPGVRLFSGWAWRRTKSFLACPSTVTNGRTFPIPTMACLSLAPLSAPVRNTTTSSPSKTSSRNTAIPMRWFPGFTTATTSGPMKIPSRSQSRWITSAGTILPGP